MVLKWYAIFLMLFSVLVSRQGNAGVFDDCVVKALKIRRNSDWLGGFFRSNTPDIGAYSGVDRNYVNPFLANAEKSRITGIRRNIDQQLASVPNDKLDPYSRTGYFRD